MSNICPSFHVIQIETELFSQNCTRLYYLGKSPQFFQVQHHNFRCIHHQCLYTSSWLHKYLGNPHIHLYLNKKVTNLFACNTSNETTKRIVSCGLLSDKFAKKYINTEKIRTTFTVQTSPPKFATTTMVSMSSVNAGAIIFAGKI